ncbi:uncharacterized protein LOC129583063 [Paramacrobiotus metropolitanus]|uniref:uncharacterized protein LOC129583063 n=1 Tax=Paramacrobiotus metropolitanus TaxID=2943436 RepID=UPI00244617E7|nr:uncharacterized protein LOC129583063 [Paramacrobiotus metropolitanus]
MRYIALLACAGIWSVTLVAVTLACQTREEGCRADILCCTDLGLQCDYTTPDFGFCRFPRSSPPLTSRQPPHPAAIATTKHSVKPAGPTTKQPKPRPTTTKRRPVNTATTTVAPDHNGREGRQDGEGLPGFMNGHPVYGNYANMPPYPFFSGMPNLPNVNFGGGLPGVNFGLPGLAASRCQPFFPNGQPFGQPHIWPNVENRGIPYKIVRDSDDRGADRFVLSAERAIDMINAAMIDCTGFQMRPAGDADTCHVLSIHIYQDVSDSKSCNGGAPHSEQYGYNDYGDNAIYINTVPFNEHQRPDAMLHIVIMHELLHAVFDLRHEHARRDRDQYVKPLLDNLKCQENAAAFEKNDLQAPYFATDMRFPYDPNSIMHASGTDYSRGPDERNNTLYTLFMQSGMPKHWYIGPWGPQPCLGYFDVAKMRSRYQCTGDNPQSRTESRKIGVLFQWKVECDGLRFQLAGQMPAGDITETSMINACAALVDEQHAVLANVDLERQVCEVLTSIQDCQYTPHHSANHTMAVVLRSNRILRTFENTRMQTRTDATRRVEQVDDSALADLRPGECQMLCQLLPGVCVAATASDNSGRVQCQLYSRWENFVPAKDSRVTTYLVQDWDTMFTYTPYA